MPNQEINLAHSLRTTESSGALKRTAWALWTWLMLLPAVAQETATATATVLNQSVVAITITAAGSGYPFVPAVSFVGGGGSGATAFATISNGAVSEITVTDGGSGYTTAPDVVIEPPSSTPFASSLVLDLACNSRVADIGPNRFAVTVQGGEFTTNRFSQAASALSLNGTSDYLSIPCTAGLYPDEMTLSLWVNLQQLDGTLVRAGDASLASDGWRGFHVTVSGGQSASLEYGDYDGSGFNASLIATPSNLVAGKWEQIVVTRTANSAVLYLSGTKLIEQDNLTPYAKPQAVDMLLGANYYFDSNPFSFCATALDAVHIYSRALSEIEVQALYAIESPPTPGPKLHIGASGNIVPLWWAASAATFGLEASSGLGVGQNWTRLDSPVLVIGDQNVVAANANTERRFFRLRKL